MRYHLYCSAGSANLVVRMVLEELGIDYSETEVASRTAKRDAEFMRLNPRGLVPVLVDRRHDLTIYETGAIILYLAEQHGRLGPSSDAPRERAALLKWLFLLSNTFHADLINRYYSDRQIGITDPDSSFFAINRKRILSHLAILDGAIGEHGGLFLLLSGLSVADFYLGCLVRWAQTHPIGNQAVRGDDLAGFPSLVRALAALQESPAVKRSFERERMPGPGFIRPLVPAS